MRKNEAEDCQITRFGWSFAGTRQPKMATESRHMERRDEASQIQAIHDVD